MDKVLKDEKYFEKMIKRYTTSGNTYKVKEMEKKLDECRKKKRLIIISDEWKKTYNIIVNEKDNIIGFIDKWIHEAWLDEYNKICDDMQKLHKTIIEQENTISSLQNQFLKNKSEIKHLKKLIPSDAVSVCCLYTYQQYYEQPQPSYEVFSNFLITSKLISILTGNETDAGTFFENVRYALKRIDELRKQNDELIQRIKELEHNIEPLHSKILRFCKCIYGSSFKKKISLNMFEMCNELQSFLKIPDKFFLDGNIFDVNFVSKCLKASDCSKLYRLFNLETCWCNTIRFPEYNSFRLIDQIYDYILISIYNLAFPIY